MANHTRGEWGVATIDCGAADDEIVTEVNGCLVSVARVFGAGEYSEARPNVEPEPSYSVSREEAAANARLIAAAPELLFQLLAAANYIDALGGESKSHRAAIAKAKGE